MNSLPLELTGLENRLRGRHWAGPPAELRGRIMQAVDADLSMQPQAAAPRRRDGWYWAAIAAAGIITLNLSVIDAARTEFSRRASIGPTDTVASLPQVSSFKSGVCK